MLTRDVVDESVWFVAVCLIHLLNACGSSYCIEQLFKQSSRNALVLVICLNVDAFGLFAGCPFCRKALQL